MLRITHSSNAAGAAKYFDEGLQRADYFAKDEHSIGEWGGKAATRLGLSGSVDKSDFVALAQNRKPEDGSKLNPRDSDRRKVGYDFTFSVPKSASVAYAVGKDERIRGAFEKAVNTTMQEIEHDMRTQTGQGKNKRHTPTGEMVHASFTHKTSRPVDGVPDPHLHRHVFVFNTTWNEQQKRFQAGEFRSIKENAPYYEAAFQSRMALQVKKLGYEVERKGLSWEIKGIEKATLDRFSRRTKLIEARAAQEATKGEPLSAKQKEQLGALTRAKKIVGQSWGALQERWKGWLNDREIQQLSQSAKKSNSSEIVKPADTSLSAQNALAGAEAHLFERKSAVEESQLKTEALKRGYGEVAPKDIEAAMTKRGYYQRQLKGRDYLTTQEAVKEEMQMLKYAREGRGTQMPLNPHYRPQAAFLNGEQKSAIRHALNDTNNVTIIAGGAGTGKTTLMKEVRDGVEARGKPFRGFAPSAAASRGVMRGEGFKSADTLAQLLVNSEMQAQTKDGVIWLDEAGLIGNKDMNAVMTIAKSQNARLLLTGDIRQHTSVAAGDSLRILEQEAGLPVARVNVIQRQREKVHYKAAVRLAADGNIDGALHKLDRMGNVIQEQDYTKRMDRLVNDYVKAAQSGETGLIVSPTHREGKQVTEALRGRLKESGALQKNEQAILQLQSTNWTQENKSDSTHYQHQELQLEFHQNAPGHKRGERWEVPSDAPTYQGEVMGQKEQENRKIDLSNASRFTVYRSGQLSIAKGERIRLTKGGKTLQGSRVNNGDLFTVTGFTKAGHLKLNTGKTLDKNFGHLAHGYVTTSHSSQGKTVDQVFIAQSSESLPAASQQQFYVSISRGRKQCRIYTDDKKMLEKSVRQNNQRLTAREVARLSRKRNHQNGQKPPSPTPSTSSMKQRHVKQQQL